MSDKEKPVYMDLRGGVAEFTRFRGRECLISGAAGTGKSYGISIWLIMLLNQYPGARMLFGRKTRASMTQSVLVTWEKVLTAFGLGHVVSGQQRGHRTSYHFPNKCEVVVAGFDDPERIKSSEYDVIWCFPGDTEVYSPTDIEKAYKREYRGELVTIETASGNKLTGTPNHPILTDDGWVKLGELKCGDYVISRGVGQPVGVGNPDVDHAPAPIADVFASLKVSGISHRVPGIDVDFHGDGSDADVEIVSANGLLQNGGVSTGNELVSQFDGGFGGADLPFLLGLGATGEPLGGGFGTLGLGDGLSASPVDVFGIDPTSLKGGFALVTDADATVFDDGPETPGTNAHLGGEPGGTLTGPVPLDGALDVGFIDMSPTLAGGLLNSSGLSVGVSFDTALGGLGAASCRNTALGEASGKHVGAHAESLREPVEGLPFPVFADRIVKVSRVDVPDGGSCHVYNLRVKSGWYVAANILTHNCNECNELTIDDLEISLSRLRNAKMPWQMFVGDCNPDAPTHWLRKRCDSGMMKEFVSLHKDNPAYWDVESGDWTEQGRLYYENVLQGLTGVRRSRLVEGKWVASEGAVFQDSWDQSRHLIDADTLPDKDRMTYFAGVDWGYRHPGVISVYGVDGEGIVYRVREIYRQGKTLNWWHAQAKRLAMDYDISAWVCDSAQPQHIALWNMSGLYAVESIKGRDSIVAGIRLIESALAKKGDGKCGLYFVRGSSGVYDDSIWYDGGEPYDPASLARVAREPSPMDVLEGKTFIPADRTSLGEWIPSVCPLQEKANLPTCTEDEFYVYSWPKDPQDGKPRKEVPVPMYDDGIDTCRYVLRHLQDGFMPGGSGDDEVEIYSDPAVDAMLN